MNKSVSILLVSAALTGPCAAQTVSSSSVSMAAVAPSDNPAPPANSFGGKDDVARPDRMYHLSWKADAPIIAAGTAWAVYAFPKIYSKDNSDSLTIAQLDKNNLPGIDRWAAGKSSHEAANASDLFFYGSMPLPFLLLADRRIRKDALQVGALYWEAMAITGLLYTGGDYFIDRYRPETYSTNLSVADRMSGNNKNSFFAGHVALVSTATFFTASVFDHYHPTSPWRWVGYGIAAGATGATAYLRHRAGKHFPTDILVGAAIGVGSGMLVPGLHRYKSNSHGTGLKLGPSSWNGQGYGFCAVYRF